jgi:hypothetical protein
MSFITTERKINNQLVVLVKLEDKLKLFKLDSFDREAFYEQHKLVYPYLEKENIHCFNLPFLDISMISKDYKNYDKLVITLTDLIKLQDLIDKKSTGEISLNFLKKNVVKDEVPPANNFDTVMEMKDFNNKFLDSNKKSYYVYFNNDNFKSFLFDIELNMSYFPELEYVNSLELDLNLYNNINGILNESLFYNKNQVLNVVGNNDLSFSNLKDRFDLLFEKNNDEKMTFDDILNNIIINIDDVLKDTKLLSFYKSSLLKILKLNQVERNFYSYLLKLKHSNNISSAKNLLKINENNTEAIPVDIFNEKLETTINNRDALKLENTSESNIVDHSKVLLEALKEF